MKYVTIHIRDRTQITLPLEQAERVLDSQQQLVKINDKDGIWRGDSINKADIVRTEQNKERENQDKRRRGPKKVEERTPDAHPSDISEYKPEFLKEDES